MFRELPIASSLRCCKGLRIFAAFTFATIRNIGFLFTFISTSDSYTALLCRAKALGFEMC